MELRILAHDPTKTSGGESALVILHNGQELRWSIPAKDLDFPFDIFEQINGYWAQCRKETQDDIFEIYSRIYSVFQNVWDINARVGQLRPLIRDLMEYHPQEDIYVWAWTGGGCVVPSNIHRSFDTNGGMAGTLERTYLEADYRSLVALSITLRVMFPIWRQFTNDTRRDTGNIFKEFQAYKLLSLSNVVNCQAIQRLQVFVQHTIPKERHNNAALLMGISSEDIPHWLLSVTVVNRLCCGDVRGYNPDPRSADQSLTTLPAYLYNFILQKLRGLESTTGNISPKYSSSYSADGDSNLSKLEGFKIKQPTSTGNIEAISVYLDIQMNKALQFDIPEPRSLVDRMSKREDFTMLVRQAYESVQKLATARLTREQVKIAAWVMSPYVAPRSIASLKKTDLLKMIAFSQAYLWVNNHQYLAALVSALAIDTMDESVGMIADRKDAIEKEEQQDLIRRFPFTRRTGSRAKNAKATNLVLTSIEITTQDLSKYQWQITLPESWMVQAGWNPRNKLIKAPTDIRTRMAQLIIDIDSIKPLESIPEHVSSEGIAAQTSVAVHP